MSTPTTHIKNLVPVDFDPFERGALIDVVPAIEPQREIFSSYLVGGEDANRSYNQSISLHLTGPFNKPAFERALKSLTDRHELLRSNFSADGNTVCIYKELPLNFGTHELITKSADERKNFIEETSRQEAQTSFDLLNGPLFRTILFNLSAEEHYLTITAHHIICDGWSLGVIIKDLARLYSCYAKNEEYDLEDAPRFSDYATQQIAFAKSDRYKQIEQYWLNQYNKEVPILNLPGTLTRPDERTYNSHCDHYALSKELVAGIKKAGADTGSTLATMLIAAFQVLLHRLTGEANIVVGIPASGQSASGNYGLVGNCVNLLPVKSTIEEDIAFVNFLKNQKKVILDAYDNQFFTFGSLLKKLRIKRDPSRIPLVPVVMNIDLGLDSDVSFVNLRHKLISNPKAYESFEIFLNVSTSEQSLDLEWTYNTQLFTAASIKQMMNDLVLVLETIVKNPSIKVADIPLLRFDNAFAWQQKWIDNAIIYNEEKPVYELIMQQAEKFPDNVAIRYNSISITYQQLNRKVNQLAALLCMSGVRAGDSVGLSIDRSEKTIITLLAIMKTGACYIPIDPEYPKDRIEYMLEDSSARILIISEKYRNQFKTTAKEIVIEEAWSELQNFSDSEYPANITTGENLVYILYTSGSTGRPKGVQITHQNLLNFLLSMQQILAVTDKDILLGVTTISFDISGLEFYLPLISGASLIITDTDTSRDGHLLIGAIRSARPTIMQATPSTWQMLLSAGWTEDTSVSKILCGGEALSRDLAKNLLTRCDSLFNLYGPTETTIWSTFKRITGSDDIITIGRPIDNTQVFILDDHGKPVSTNSDGEIYIAGDGVAKGYVNRQELTKERFVDNPFSPDRSDKMYRTGDIGKFLDNGEIQCLGRIDQQVKIRGHRIELEEIEHLLVHQKDIEQAVVIAREDRPGDQRLAAYIILSDVNAGTDNKISKWRQSLQNSLPAYIIPNDFVILSSFPLTANGKIDRKALPMPASGLIIKEDKYQAPRNHIEKVIADTWAKLLKIEKVSITDDFFELGGHSLIAGQAMTILAKETGKRLPLTILFRHPVLEQFALLFGNEDNKDEVSSQNSKRTLSGLVKDKVFVATTEPQREIWISCLMGGNDSNCSYNLSISEKFSGQLDRSCLEDALQEIINRHESLRSTFSQDGKDICISGSVKVDLYFEDISSLNSEEQHLFVENYAKKNAGTPYDLVNGPLFRVALFKLSEEEHYFTFAVHHIICDGWSLGIFLQELSTLYSAYLKGEEPAIEEAPRFSKYAAEELEFCSSNEYKITEGYWLDQYKDGAPVLELPTDFPRPVIRTYKSHRDDFDFNSELIFQINKIGIQTGCSLSITLRAAFEIYLYCLTGQDDIVVGIPTAGQLASGNYELIGHCANLLPLRTKIDINKSFIKYMEERKLATIDAYDHQRYTFGTLLKKLNLARDKSRVPLVPVVFNAEIGMDEGVSFAGLRHEMIFNPREYETFEIFLSIGGSKYAPTLQWSYNTQLFTSATIKRMMTDFEFLVKALIKDPSVLIRDVSLKSNEEVIDQQKRLNDTKVHYQKDKPLYELISEQVKKSPDKIAINYNEHQINYRDLDTLSTQLAALLIDNGVSEADKVGVAMERSHKTVITLLAVIKSGATYIPLDPEFPKERIEFMLQDSSAKILLTSKKYQGHFQTNATEILIEEAWARLSDYSEKATRPAMNPNALVYILYTSGSTGKPKGVQIFHYSLMNFLYSMKKILSVNENDRLLAITTISFDISGLELYLPLICGATLLLADANTVRDGNLLLNTVKSYMPTIMQATPVTWQILLEAGWSEDVMVKTICSGGEALTKELANKLNNRSRNLYNLYGPTETTIWSTFKKVERHDDITIGKPIDNTQVYILDTNLKAVARNAVGEICISGDGVAQGYYNRPELTLEKFVQDPFSKVPGDKMYRTGDLGRMLPNGEIECLGRADQQIKIRGFRIEPGEIEHCLLQLKDIKASVVVAREDRRGDQRLVAYVVPRDVAIKSGKNSTIAGNNNYNGLAEASAEQLQRWKQALKNYLPSYMIPNDFVVLHHLPLTPNGKVDKKALPSPDIADRVTNKYTAPRNQLETTLTEIWKRLLRVEQVSIYDNFFDLGGHSLLAMRLISVIRKELAVDVPLTDIFESTIQSIARKIKSEQEVKVISVQSYPKPDTTLTVSKALTVAKEPERGLLELDINARAKYMVPIKNGGAKLPFFGIISINSYRLLSDYLPNDQPLYYLPPTESSSVEDIASHYIKEIKLARPSGPYCIGGFCNAGAVALEIAHQLESQGDEVSALVLFEYYSPHAWISRKSFKYMMRRLSYYKERFSSLSKSGQSIVELSKFVVEKSKKWNPFTKSAPPKFITSPEYWKYVHKPYSGKVILFQAGKPPLDVNNSQMMGWSDYFKGDVETITVEGGHLGIFREPAIQKLAENLNTVFEELNHELKSKRIRESFKRRNLSSVVTKRMLP